MNELVDLSVNVKQMKLNKLILYSGFFFKKIYFKNRRNQSISEKRLIYEKHLHTQYLNVLLIIVYFIYMYIT